jgi:hypothetical protein
MTKRTNISRLKYSTIVLVAVAALMGSAHIAKAKVLKATVRDPTS